MQRLIDHEVFQMTILEWLGSNRFLGSLIFGKGAMLRLCHELPRYSPDMDFWFFKQKDYGQFFNQLNDALSRDHDVTYKRNGYSSILMEIRREKRMPKLKIEIHKTIAPIGSSEEKIAFSTHLPVQVLVRGFTLKHMLRNKVLALIDHGQMQDAFDLEFLVRKGVALDLTETQRRKAMKRLKGFRQKDFEVNLRNTVLPELREQYTQHGFDHLEEALCSAQCTE